MTVDYRYLLVDASTGLNIGEIPLTVSSFSRVLNGVGALSGTLPLDHPLATTANLTGDREVTVLRNNAPVWNGPITYFDASFSSRAINITAREASWYMSKRTLEVSKHWNADLYYIVRRLVTLMTTKVSTSGDGMTAGSNINAALPRFSVSPASGNSGTTKDVRYFGSARHVIADIVQDLVDDPTTGLDYRMDYSTGSTRQSCQRTLTIGSPSLGSQRAHPLTEHVLYDFVKTEDRERAATRVHTLGAGYTYTLQNSGSVTAGDILIESVFERTDTSNQTFIQNYTRSARRLSIPPVASYTISYVPNDAGALTYGFADVGDSVNMQVGSTTVLHSLGYRRVIQIDVSPPTDQAPEIVTFTLNIPLDQLGT